VLCGGVENVLLDGTQGKKTEVLAPHSLAQAESVAFSLDGKSIFAVSEKANSPVVRYRSPD
jgi:hypothetical protein